MQSAGGGGQYRVSSDHHAHQFMKVGTAASPSVTAAHMFSLSHDHVAGAAAAAAAFTPSPLSQSNLHAHNNVHQAHHGQRADGHQAPAVTAQNALQQQQQEMGEQQQLVIYSDSTELPSAIAASRELSNSCNKQLLSAGAAAAADHDEGCMESEGDRGGAGGIRWPRQETLALIKIRTDMDVSFRDASPKGPLWEEVSRYFTLPTPHPLKVLADDMPGHPIRLKS